MRQRKIKLKSLRDARLAQLVEHYLDTVGVTGSSPVLRTILSSILLSFFSFAFLYPLFIRNHFQKKWLANG